MKKKYTETGYKVQRREPDELRQLAQYLRDFAASECGLVGSRFDVVRLIEKWGLRRSTGDITNPDYVIVEDSELPGRAAEYRPPPVSGHDADSHLFVFRESVWNAACLDDAEARHILAHEVAHCVLQHPPVSYARQYQDEIVDQNEDSECQANRFADELLMDERLIQSKEGYGSIVEKFGVTNETAVNRLRRVIAERNLKKGAS